MVRYPPSTLSATATSVIRFLYFTTHTEQLPELIIDQSGFSISINQINITQMHLSIDLLMGSSIASILCWEIVRGFLTIRIGNPCHIYHAGLFGAKQKYAIIDEGYFQTRGGCAGPGLLNNTIAPDMQHFPLHLPPGSLVCCHIGHDPYLIGLTSLAESWFSLNRNFSYI